MAAATGAIHPAITGAAVTTVPAVSVVAVAAAPPGVQVVPTVQGAAVLEAEVAAAVAGAATRHSNHKKYEKI